MPDLRRTVSSRNAARGGVPLLPADCRVGCSHVPCRMITMRERAINAVLAEGGGTVWACVSSGTALFVSRATYRTLIIRLFEQRGEMLS